MERRPLAPPGSPLLTLELDDARWWQFVAASSEATPFHHPAWARLLAACYGYQPAALALPDASGAIGAGLPVVEVQAPLKGRRWISLPFTDHCRPLGADGPEQADLVGALDAARRAAGVAALEVRADLAVPPARGRAVAVLHTLRLQPDAQAVFRTFHRSQVQRNIARAERDGITVRRGDAPGDLSRIFYGLHLRTRQRQGTPVQPRRFFDLLWRRVLDPGLGFVLLAYAGDTPIAGAVFLHWNRTIIYKYGASDPAYWKLRPNNLIFWTAIRWGCEQGYRTFDFGRTDLDNQGLRDFKRGWGAEERPLVYSALADRPAPQRDHRPGPSGRTLAAVIRRSPPWVCRVLGECLYKYAA